MTAFYDLIDEKHHYNYIKQRHRHGLFEYTKISHEGRVSIALKSWVIRLNSEIKSLQSKSFLLDK